MAKVINYFITTKFPNKLQLFMQIYMVAMTNRKHGIK